MAREETKAIERASVEAFLRLYNPEMGTCFYIKECADAPDVRCLDDYGAELNVEVTLTEDRAGDIQARLGRSQARSLEELRAHLADVRAGRAHPLERVSCLSGNVAGIASSRIQAKLVKSYGPNTALVVRDTSGVSWDWDLVIEDLRRRLDLSLNPFDRGIWILGATKDRLFRVV